MFIDILVNINCEEKTCKGCDMCKMGAGQVNCAIFQKKLDFDSKLWAHTRLYECKTAEEMAKK